MKLDTLVRIAAERNIRIGRAGARLIMVTYPDNPKAYTYHGSVYSVAERLGLIPEPPVDGYAEAERIVDGLLQGRTMDTILGIHDTIRGMVTGRTPYHGMLETVDVKYREAEVGKDEYDRWVYRFIPITEKARN